MHPSGKFKTLKRNITKHSSVKILEHFNMGFMHRRRKYIPGIILSLGLILLLFSNNFMKHLQSRNLVGSVNRTNEQFTDIKRAIEELKDEFNSNQSENQPIIWIHGTIGDFETIEHIRNVFERLGYELGSQFSSWNVLWARGAPFIDLSHALANLKPDQKVNHIPGIAYVANKKILATSYNIEQIPKAFNLPKETELFQAYAKEHPDYMWIEKDISHRGIKIKKKEDIDPNKKNVFIQRYIGNPLLIGGRRFDFGVYTVVTSIDPLRVYVYNDDWVVRMCPVDYYPFDPDNIDKYVIRSNYVVVWEFPPLIKVYDETYANRKESVLSYLRTHGYNHTKILNTVYSTIKEVFMQAQGNILKNFQKTHGNYSKRHFFEITRFDFMLDNDSNVYLLEANSGPNFATNTPDTIRNGLMYEQLLYSMTTMIGLGKNTKKDFIRSSKYSQHMVAAERNSHVYTDWCVSSHCENNCKDVYCNLCKRCLNEDLSLDLKYTVMEHNNRGDWKRILPRTFQNSDEAKRHDPLKDPHYKSTSEKNQLMAFWIKGKCMQDNRWCI